MKILIVSYEWSNTGGGLALSCNKIKKMIELNHEVYTCDSGSFEIKTTINGVKADVAKLIMLEYKLKEEIIKYNDVDIIIGFGGGYNGYYASLIAKKLKKRFILCLRGSDVNLAKWDCTNSWYIKEAAKVAIKIICLSLEMKLNLLDICPNLYNRLIVIPNSINDKKNSICFKNLPSKLIMGTASTFLNEKKGVTNLIYMLKKLKDIIGIPFEFYFIGNVDKDLLLDYEKIVNDFKLDKEVKFLGYKSRTDFWNILKQWDLYVQGSVCEGCSNSLIEALQHGVPFISTKTGYFSELLYNKYPMLFFSSFNPDNMANDLLKIIYNNTLINQYHYALKIMESDCNYNTILNRWTKVLDDVSLSNVTVDSYVMSICLHDISDDVYDHISTPARMLEAFVDLAAKTGYTICSFKNYLTFSEYERKKCIVLTFDDGYESVVSTAFPILNKFGFNATVFVCTNLVGKINNWNTKDSQIRRHANFKELKILYDNGWEIGSHGMDHQNLCKLSDNEIRLQLSKSKRKLEKLFGDVITFAYPYGEFSDFIKKLIKKYYLFSFSVSKGGNYLPLDKYQIRRYSLDEIHKYLLNANALT